jgi:SAM-dependent methyltransferase
MFSKSAKYYDVIYEAAGKNYREEANQTHKLIQKHQKSAGDSLLDVGCGTGLHAGWLSKYYKVEGFDLDPAILSVARRKHPHIRFHRQDMADFRLARRFDAIICLFSAIGYVRTTARLNKAIQSMADHLIPGGVLLIEPWFTPKEWHAGRTSVLSVNTPQRNLVRTSYSSQKGRISLIDFHYLVGTPSGIRHAEEQHRLGLFSSSEYLEAFHLAGLKVIHDPKGLDGRGLYIGMKPLDGTSR